MSDIAVIVPAVVQLITLVIQVAMWLHLHGVVSEATEAASQLSGTLRLRRLEEEICSDIEPPDIPIR